LSVKVAVTVLLLSIVSVIRVVMVTTSPLQPVNVELIEA
jgi:hypothetical protein